jgi:intracellular sulfur oxidation DsrE/DsrF family protein
VIARVSIYLIIVFLAAPLVHAESKEKQQIADVLNSREPVTGVVFEIVGGDAYSLLRAVARARQYVDKIKARFPGAKFVIVSHGYEQFSMLLKNQLEYPVLHHQIKNMAKYDGIPFQVCGTFAEANDVIYDEFVEYVTVLPSAPAQIDAYKQRGYRLIEMDINL